MPRICSGGGAEEAKAGRIDERDPVGAIHEDDIWADLQQPVVAFLALAHGGIGLLQFRGAFPAPMLQLFLRPAQLRFRLSLGCQFPVQNEAGCADQPQGEQAGQGGYQARVREPARHHERQQCRTNGDG